MQSGMAIGVPGYCRIEVFENVEISDDVMHVLCSVHLTRMVIFNPLHGSGENNVCLDEHFTLLHMFLILKMRVIMRPYIGDGGSHIEFNGGLPLISFQLTMAHFP